jgi:cephalosporin hydroxylase
LSIIHTVKLAISENLVGLKTFILQRTFVGPFLIKTATNLFQKLYCAFPKKTFVNTYWLSVPTLKCPLDLWVYQEIIHEQKPDVIIETGTYAGGSALFLASMCDLVGNGRIITIDIETNDNRPEHPRIWYLHGDSTAPEIVRKIKETIKVNESVLVILDSDHHKEHVLCELKQYSPLVTPGSYLIVEDTHFNGNPIRPEFGPGPMEAVNEFLQQSTAFMTDRTKEKHFMTFNPKGYLKRV